MTPQAEACFDRLTNTWNQLFVAFADLGEAVDHAVVTGCWPAAGGFGRAAGLFDGWLTDELLLDCRRLALELRQAVAGGLTRNEAPSVIRGTDACKDAYDRLCEAQLDWIERCLAEAEGSLQ